MVVVDVELGRGGVNGVEISAEGWIRRVLG